MQGFLVRYELLEHPHATPSSPVWDTHMKPLSLAVPYLQGNGCCVINDQENGLWLQCFQVEMDAPFLSLWGPIPHVALTAEPGGSTYKSNQRCHHHSSATELLD